MRLISFLLFISLVILASCTKNNSGGTIAIDCNSALKSFSANVQPITSTRCAISGCHASGSTNGPGELITYQQLRDAKNEIRAAVYSGLMPQSGSLTQAQINTIVCWVDSGAPNN